MFVTTSCCLCGAALGMTTTNLGIPRSWKQNTNTKYKIQNLCLIVGNTPLTRLMFVPTSCCLCGAASGRRQQPIWESLDLGTISSKICVRIQEGKYKNDNKTKMQRTQIQIHINKQNVNQFGNPWVLGPSVAKYVPGVSFWPQSARQAVICYD